MPTTKKPADAGKSTSTSRSRTPAAATTAAAKRAPAKPEAPVAAKPPRRTPAEPVVEAATTPDPAPAQPKKDRTMLVAVSFLAAVALFAAGFGIGRASGDDAPAVIGSGQIQVAPGMGGLGPYGGGMGMYPERPGRQGGGYLPGPGRGGQVTPPVISDQGFLGISGMTAATGGVEVTEVQPGSGAEVAGLQVGDHIVAVNGTRIVGMGQFANLVARARPGTTITLDVERGGSTVTLSATLGSRAG